MPTNRTSTAVGIDLGTTNSVVASLDAYGRPVVLANRDGRNITPSVIYFGADPPAVGDEAKEWARLGNDEIASFFKPHMGSPLVPAPLPRGATTTRPTSRASSSAA